VNWPARRRIDLVTFFVLLALSGSNPEIFRTGWFLESPLTELGILMVLRTYLPLHRSPPGQFLKRSTAPVAIGAGAIAAGLAWPPLSSGNSDCGGDSPREPEVPADASRANRQLIAIRVLVPSFLFGSVKVRTPRS